MTRSRDIYGEEPEDPTLPIRCVCQGEVLCTWHQMHFRGCTCRTRGREDVACRARGVEEPPLREKLWRLVSQSMGGTLSTDRPKEAEDYLIGGLKESEGTIRDIGRQLAEARARKRRIQNALSSLRELMPRKD